MHLLSCFDVEGLCEYHRKTFASGYGGRLGFLMIVPKCGEISLMTIVL